MARWVVQDGEVGRAGWRGGPCRMARRVVQDGEVSVNDDGVVVQAEMVGHSG